MTQTLPKVLQLEYRTENGDDGNEWNRLIESNSETSVEEEFNLRSTKVILRVKKWFESNEIMAAFCE